MYDRVDPKEIPEDVELDERLRPKKKSEFHVPLILIALGFLLLWLLGRLCGNG